MKSFATICLLLFCFYLQAQVSFKAVAPQQPVAAGDAFQVQYILEGGDKNVTIQPPDFTPCRLISGPNIYSGTITSKEGIIQVRNFVYTVEAARPGKLFLPPGTLIINNRVLKSNAVVVDVVAKKDAAGLNKKGDLISSSYYLQPGEDPYQKIRENLFVKVQVDKRSCIVGEPVLATFKLYSRLESRSDIIKNPGFYGFTVYEMAGLADKQVSAENINGKLFDVHTIRKVQLYPLRAGRYIIDPMEVQNRVEFSRSAVNKKTEQEIAEGMMGIEEEEPVKAGTEVFETSMSTAPVEVEVKAVPEKSKPAGYAGAVGRFTITSGLSSETLAKNEQGFFEIVIEGKGNFTQISAPVVPWPAGMEGFEPEVKDEFDKSRSPLYGRRIFRYPFVCAGPGSYILPAVSISFFDIDSNRYKTAVAKGRKVDVSNETKKVQPVAERKMSFAERNERAARTAGMIAGGAVLLILLYWIFIRKEKKPRAELLIKKPVLPSAEELLQPVYEKTTADDRTFYTTLQSAIWLFAAQRFSLSGSEMNKQGLAVKMNERLADQSVSAQLLQVLAICEAGMFTNASLAENREELLQQTKEVFEKTDTALNQAGTPGSDEGEI